MAPLKLADHRPPAEPPSVRTLGKIAADLGVAPHRVDYIIRTRRIREAARAGRFRLYDRQAFEAIRDELDAIDGKTSGVSDG